MSNDEYDDDFTLPLGFSGWYNLGPSHLDEPPAVELEDSKANSRATSLNKNDSSCPCGNDRVNSDEKSCWWCGCIIKR